MNINDNDTIYNNMNDYWDTVQNYIKDKIEDDNITNIIKSLNKDNLQAIIHQKFNQKISVEECAEELLTMFKKNNVPSDASNALVGDRSMNTLENKILRFKDFKSIK